MRRLVILIALCAFSCFATAAAIRSSGAKAEFKREHPCPATGGRSGACGGYVIDHIVPLACGRADAPANVQWQTVAEAKASRWELKGCRR